MDKTLFIFCRLWANIHQTFEHLLFFPMSGFLFSSIIDELLGIVGVGGRKQVLVCDKNRLVLLIIQVNYK